MMNPTLADVDRAHRDIDTELARADQAGGPAVARNSLRQAAQHARRLWAALDALATEPVQTGPGLALNWGGSQIRRTLG